MSKQRKLNVRLRVATTLDTVTDASGNFHVQDVIYPDHGGKVFRLLDATYYAWLRCRMERAKKAFESGKLPRETWQSLRAKFGVVHEWAIDFIGEKILLDAIANLNEKTYRPPSSERVADVVESWDERAAIMEHDGGLDRDAAEKNAVSLISRELTPEDVESFKALGVEVHIKSKPGEFTLVPEYTDKDRIEISAEDLRKLSMVMHAFPGSEITYVGPQQDIPGEFYTPDPAPTSPPKKEIQSTQPKPRQPNQQARLF